MKHLTTFFSGCTSSRHSNAGIVGIAIGLGTSLGVALHSLPAGVALGAAAGLALMKFRSNTLR